MFRTCVVCSPSGYSLIFTYLPVRADMSHVNFDNVEIVGKWAIHVFRNNLLCDW